MVPISQTKPVERPRYRSPFRTTHRRVFLHAVSNLIIIPTYLITVLHITRLFWQWFAEDGNPLRTALFQLVWTPTVSVSVQSLITAIVFVLLWGSTLLVWGVTLAPFVLSLCAIDHPHWRNGLSRRGLAVAITFLLITNFLLKRSGLLPGKQGLYSSEEWNIFLIIHVALWIFYAIRLISDRKLTRWAILGALAALLVLLFLPSSGFYLQLTLNGIVLPPEYFLLFTAMTFNLWIAATYMIQSVKLGQWIPREPSFRLALTTVASLILIVICGVLTLRSQALTDLDASKTHPDNFLFALASLAAMALGVQPRHWFSRQRAYFRNALAAVREDSLRQIASPTLEELNLLNRIRSWLSRTITIDNLGFGFPLSLFLGFVIVPVIEIVVLAKGVASFADLITTGLPSGLILALIYLLIWAYRHRQKYIVLPFKVDGDDKDRAELGGISMQVSHALTKEIRQIGLLMQTRQVDSAQSTGGSALAHFVSSGQEPKFIEELGALTSIDESPSGRLLSSIVPYFINSLAVIRVRGAIRRRADASLELWVELSRQRDQVVSVDKVIVPMSRADDLDERTLQQISREMAIKLVLKLGQSYHLASNWQSLRLFLEGLEASTERNWWGAINAYRAAIQHEEAERGSFGIGHYHLGATLLSLGETDQAKKHLELAEASGPPLGETQYLLALALVNEHWSHLDEDFSLFKTIERRSLRALKLRVQFPEAMHLLGSAYYQRAKLMERKETQIADAKTDPSSRKTDTSSRVYWESYRRAIYWLRRAVNAYHRQILRSLEQKRTSPATTSEFTHLLQARMTAAHQLADALRALSFFQEAETYYQDFLTVFPENIRTLYDMAKTYCMAEQWQRADEFITRNLFTVPEAEWSADAHFYAGWAYAGGISDTLKDRYYRKAPSWLAERWKNLTPRRDQVARHFRSFARRLSQIVNQHEEQFVAQEHDVAPDHYAMPENAVTYEELLVLYGKAVQHLDFAFQQRPRFLTRWLQTEWFVPFAYAKKNLCAHAKDNGGAPMTNDSAYASPTNPDKGAIFGLQGALWLAWRARANGHFQAGDAFINLIGAGPGEHPTKLLDFPKWYEQFLVHKMKLALLLDDIEATGRLHGMSHAWQKLRLAASVLDNWKLIRQGFEEKLRKLEAAKPYLGNNAEPSFAHRWMFQTTSDAAVFTVRVLMEAWAYEAAFVAAEQAEALIGDWYKCYWGTDDHKPYRITPYVFRYNYATLLAMKAYCALRLKDHPETAARLLVYDDSTYVQQERRSGTGKVGDEYRDLAERAQQTIQQDISTALTHFPRHPLAMLVQAQLYRRERLLHEAANEFQRLLQVIAPYDPIEYISNWQRINKPSLVRMVTQPEILSVIQKHFKVRSYITFLERVTGKKVDGAWNERKKKQEQTAVTTFWNDVETEGVRQQWEDLQSHAGYPQHPVTLDQLWNCLYELDVQQRAEDYKQRASRDRMRKQDYVSGWLQLANFVNRSIVHTELSDVFFLIPGRGTSGIGHLTQAVLWENHRDKEADLLITLAERMEEIDRFRDAEAVLAEVRTLRVYLDPQTFSITKSRQAPILESILKSRIAHYANGLEIAEAAWTAFTALPEQDDNSIPAVFHGYQERLAHPQLIDYFGKFLNALKTWTPVLDPARRQLIYNLSPLAFQVMSSRPLPRLMEFAFTGLDLSLMKGMIWDLHQQAWIRADSEIVTDNNLPAEAVNKVIDQQPHLNIKWHIAVRMAEFVCKEALKTLEQQCQLANNIAYSRIELRSDIRQSMSPAHYRTQVTIPNAVLINGSIQIAAALLNSTPPDSHEIARRYRVLIGNYLDTKGWMLFRVVEEALARETHVLDDEKRAALLKDVAAALDPLLEGVRVFYSISIIHYHISRIHLAIAERLWQGLKKTSTETVGDVAVLFQEHLHIAKTYWRNAKENDDNMRLASRLNWLGERIETYSRAWEKRHTTTLQTP